MFCAYGFALLPAALHAASLLPVYPPPFPSFDIDAQDINDAGVVTGGVAAGNGGYSGMASNIQPLGKPTGYDYFSGFGINNSGQVAGNAMVLSNTYWHAAVANPDGTFQDLGTLGGKSSYATAISDNGWVTGYSEIAGNLGMRAFLYANGVMEDLGTLGYAPAVGELSKAFDTAETMLLFTATASCRI
jgi:probable HAF family extracellular repeat protein